MAFSVELQLLFEILVNQYFDFIKPLQVKKDSTEETRATIAASFGLFLLNFSHTFLLNTPIKNEYSMLRRAILLDFEYLLIWYSKASLV